MEERNEALMRIVVGIVSGIIIGLWKGLTQFLGIINFFITIFKNKRHDQIANFCEMFNTQLYTFWKYMTFVSNKRPFPFNPLEKNFSKFQ